MSRETATESMGWARTRPIRIAFLVEPGPWADRILDSIFADGYARWGGRFSLIVPCADGQVVPDYWPWLEAFDPDVVYAYVELSSQAVLDIHERLVPADYIVHRVYDKPSPDVFDFRPRYAIAALSSLSTVFRLYRHSPIEDGKKIKLIDSWHTETRSRFLTDNFGTYHTSMATSMYPADARSAATLLTVVSEEYVQGNYGVPRDLDRVATEQMAFAEFVGKRATSMSMLSSLYVPRIEIRDHRWSTAFNLVVGESFEDRLLFWNARLLIPTWLDGELSCFRVTMDQLRDQAFLGLLTQLINTRNHVNGGSGGQSQLRVRSASHAVPELDEALALLRDAKLWSVSAPVEVISGGHVIPLEASLRHVHEQTRLMVGGSYATEWRGFRWHPPVARPAIAAPDHLADTPPGQSFAQGRWALDLCFEYEGDQLRHAQQNVWILPKRWRMAGAFEAKYTTRGFAPNAYHASRTNGNGNVTLFSDANPSLESITVPNAEQAIQRALCWDAAIWHAEPQAPPWPSQKVQWMRPSSEMPRLIGVLRMLGGLANAKRLLLHPFVQGTLAGLGGAPNLADADVRATVDALAKRARGKPVFDVRMEDERGALAALIVKAAQSIKMPKMYVALDDLRERWNTYREAYWAQRPDEVTGAEGDLKHWEQMEERAIDDCLAEMRTRRMLFQGYPWTCATCQHRNWTDFQALRPSVACEVCLTEMDLPIGIPWYFRPNEFLIESLRSHSVLSLVWVLSVLRDRARSSFVYVGSTCFGFSDNYDEPDAEADLLAIVDGTSILCEVKSAWRSLRAVHVADFVALAKRLRPDTAILAVMEGGDGKRVDQPIAEAKAALEAEGIAFELVTLDDYRPEDAPFVIGA